MRLACATIAVLTLASIAEAEQIRTRAALDAMLNGSEEYLEDFEEVSVHGGTSLTLANPFNYVTGAPLWADLLPGVTYSSTGLMRMYGGFLFGDDSNILQAANNLTITFDVPQVAFGFDLDGVANASYHQNITFKRFGVDVGNIEYDMSPGETSFIGWHDEAGVTSVTIETTAQGFTGYAEIDNVAWGIDAPFCMGDLVASDTFLPPPDGAVDGADLAYLLGEWGSNVGSLADLVGSETFMPPPDGLVDGADLAVLLGAWGGCN